MLKFPRIPHLSFSESIHRDDVVAKRSDMFSDKIIVVSEKLDGECSGLSCEGCHARSLDSRDHHSRHWLKGLWGKIRHDIPSGYEIFGENVFARHSIFYDRLETYFYVFAIFQGTECLSWEETKEWSHLLQLNMVPTIYVGLWNERVVQSCWSGISAFGPDQEGYVVRNIERFSHGDFSDNVAKFVRKNHVQTDHNWMSQPIVPNKCRN